MNKSRIEAFTDAIIAIIMTIMVLEIKVPHGPTWDALFQEKSYFFSYLISFFLIVTTWYNHHFIFINAKVISRKAFWINMIWLFFMSFAPISTGWISEEPHSKAAAYFFLIIYLFWGITFYCLTRVLIDDTPDNAAKLRQVIQPKRLCIEVGLLIVGAILINWIPISILPILGIDIFSWIFLTPKND